MELCRFSTKWESFLHPCLSILLLRKFSPEVKAHTHTHVLLAVLSLSLLYEPAVALGSPSLLT